jgi:hypothetical protein
VARSASAILAELAAAHRVQASLFDELAQVLDAQPRDGWVRAADVRRVVGRDRLRAAIRSGAVGARRAGRAIVVCRDDVDRLIEGLPAPQQCSTDDGLPADLAELLLEGP